MNDYYVYIHHLNYFPYDYFYFKDLPPLKLDQILHYKDSNKYDKDYILLLAFYSKKDKECFNYIKTMNLEEINMMSYYEWDINLMAGFTNNLKLLVHLNKIGYSINNGFTAEGDTLFTIAINKNNIKLFEYLLKKNYKDFKYKNIYWHVAFLNKLDFMRIIEKQKYMTINIYSSYSQNNILTVRDMSLQPRIINHLIKQGFKFQPKTYSGTYLKNKFKRYKYYETYIMNKMFGNGLSHIITILFIFDIGAAYIKGRYLSIIITPLYIK